MRILVVACGDCGIPPPPWQGDLGEGFSLFWERTLCAEGFRPPPGQDPSELGLVFLTRPGVERRARLAGEAIEAGVHPLRIRFLEGWWLMDWSEVERHLFAAAIRMGGLGDLLHAPLRETRWFQGELPRRGFLSPLPRHREPLPRIEPSRCRADAGCDLCVEACPADAMTRGLPPVIDPVKCTSCGLCLASCPTEAIRHPALDRGAFLAEAAALARGSPANLLVGCGNALRRLTRSDVPRGPIPWRILELPSLGLLRPIDVLRLRGKGFERVVGLSHGPCCPGSPGPFAVAAALVESLGWEGIVATWDLREGPLPASWAEPLRKGPRPWPDAESLQGFAASLVGPTGVRLRLPGPGAGLVRIDEVKCTLCEVCAERCPRQALRIEESGGAVRITFDAGACDGCGLCARVCPERAVDVEYGVDTEALGHRRTLAEDAWVLCASCGARVAPRKLIARVMARVKLLDGLDLCPDCKPLRRTALAKP